MCIFIEYSNNYSVLEAKHALIQAQRIWMASLKPPKMDIATCGHCPSNHERWQFGML